MKSIAMIAMAGFIAVPLATGAAQDSLMPAHATTQSNDKVADDAAKHTNRLAKETSPYLRQHAHNPVDWYAWGEEAFGAARAQDKPIFLSIGYSTCYWCHVMERESFENEGIAALMNENFINIKVDREERPDVDDIYMTATQLLSGHGGWPMSVFLEPKSLKPFLAGTYFPPMDSFGRPGFPTVLRQVAAYWKDQREGLIAQADGIADAVKQQHALAVEPKPIGKRQVDQAIADLLSVYDSADGGFTSPMQRAPKFPTPVNLDFLIGAAWDQMQPRKAVLHTLDRMAIGGMYDQIGGGFHRYSVDAQWLVPHFEKMLYDNGQLVCTYARAYELTKDAFYAEIVRETLEYVLREMTSAEGAFYSAQDAEVNAREGGNYIWTAEELREALSNGALRDEVDFALEIYGFTKGTNFQDPHHPEDGQKNVVFLVAKPAELARRMKIPQEQFEKRVNQINSVLLKARDMRLQPGTDDKVLTGWNGMMIAAMADAGRVLDEAKYKDAATRAATFVLDSMRTSDGHLLRSYRDGQAKIDAFLEDYALMIKGVIALHRATGDQSMLQEAQRLASTAKQLFWDSGAGAYFDTREGQSDLFVRIKSTYDGAIPCGNSVMLHNLLDLHELTHQSNYLDDAAATLRSLSSVIDERPSSAINSTLALKRFLDKYPQNLDGAAVAAKPVPAQPRPPSVALGGKPQLVTIEPSTTEVQIKPGSPADLELNLTIARRYHINSSQPGDEFLIPLKIELIGCEGLKLTAIYPPGESYKAEFSEGTINVHHGTISIPLRIEQTGTFSGRPQLVLTYQACTGKECFDPKREIVPLRIIAQR